MIRSRKLDNSNRNFQISMLLNASQRSHVRTSIKKVLAAIESGDKSAAEAAFKAAVPAIDRLVSKELMHRNKAARHKSRMNKHIRAL